MPMLSIGYFPHRSRTLLQEKKAHVKEVSEMKKELLILKRRKAKELHEKDWSNRKIAKYLLASKDSAAHTSRSLMCRNRLRAAFLMRRSSKWRYEIEKRCDC